MQSQIQFTEGESTPKVDSTYLSGKSMKPFLFRIAKLNLGWVGVGLQVTIPSKVLDVGCGEWGVGGWEDHALQRAHPCLED